MATRTSGTRRLMSMCLLLALVILLMQKAADPIHVRSAFQALGVPLDSVPAHTTAAKLLSGERTSMQPDLADPATEPSLWAATCQDLIPRLLDNAAESQVLALTRHWLTGDRHASHELNGLRDEGSSLLGRFTEETQASGLAKAEKSVWLANLARFQLEWQSAFPLQHQLSNEDRGELEDSLGSERTTVERDTSPSAEFRHELTDYLDHRLLEGLRDAAPWSEAESLAFFRLLTMRQGGAGQDVGSRLEPTFAPLVNTRELSAEAEQYRGRDVRFRGTVRRVQYVDRQRLDMGVDSGYWVLWLRGEDDAVQPVAVYTLDSAASLLEDRLESGQADFPAVEVHAVAAKRLAYAAAGGLEVAPTLFANELIVTAESATAPPVREMAELWPAMRQALWIGGLLSAIVLLPIFWQWRSHTVRRRMSRRLPVILIGSMAFASCSGAAAQGKFQPPWATPSSNADAELAALLRTRLSAVLAAGGATELARLSDAERDFPTSGLQLLSELSKFEKQVPAALDEPLEVNGMRLKSEVVQGWARLATPVALSEDQLGWFASEHGPSLYRLEIQATSPGAAATAARPPVTQPQHRTVYCRSVPSAWLDTAQLHQPVRIDSVALYPIEPAAPEIAEPAPWCFLAERPQWLLSIESPSEVNLQPPLPPHWAFLGALGWDLAHLDIIVAHDKQSLSVRETDAFYSMLHLSQAALRERAAGTKPISDPLQLLSRAGSSTGQAVQWPVRIVSGTRVPVTRPHQQRLLGSDHYFQFDGFVDIGRDRISFQTSSNSPPLEFAGEFPLTVVSLEPFGLGPESGGEVTSWQVGRYAQLDGWFYRLWSYQSELVKQNSAQARQVVPLVIATGLQPSQPPPRQRGIDVVGWFGYALTAATLCFLGIILALAFKKEPRRRHETPSQS